MAFKRLYEDVRFDYEVSINGKKADIVINVGNKKFFIEIERKREPKRVIRENVFKWKKDRKPSSFLLTNLFRTYNRYTPPRYRLDSSS